MAFVNGMQNAALNDESDVEEEALVNDYKCVDPGSISRWQS